MKRRRENRGKGEIVITGYVLNELEAFTGKGKASKGEENPGCRVKPGMTGNKVLQPQ